MKPAEIRMTLVLLAIIFGVSAMLLFGKALLRPSVPQFSAPVTELVPAPQSQLTPPTSESPQPKMPPQMTQPESAGPGAVSAGEPVGSGSGRSAELSIQTGQAATPATAHGPVETVTHPETIAVVPPSNQAPSNQTLALTQAPPSRVPSRYSSSFEATTLVKAPTLKIPSKPVLKTVAGALSVASPPPEKPLPHKKKGTIIFIFDDAGHNLKQLEPFLNLPFPCTIAVLPGLQYSKETARRVRAAGKEVILHQPMQAINLSMDPGPGALKKGMSADQIKTVIRKNLAEVGPVVGINNHEGSQITADRRSMEAVFDVVKEKGIYFLDSRTTVGTVAPVIARERNMTIWERAVFLDNSQDKMAIIEAVTGGMKIAEQKGSAIMIGHIWSNDLAGILTSMYPELVSQGFSLSTIAEIATHGDFDE